MAEKIMDIVLKILAVVALAGLLYLIASFALQERDARFCQQLSIDKYQEYHCNLTN